MSATNLDLPVLISADQIRRREFVTIRRGYDPDQVRAYLEQLADQSLLSGLSTGTSAPAPVSTSGSSWSGSGFSSFSGGSSGGGFSGGGGGGGGGGGW